MKKPIAITCGDPAGVGPEIIETWLEQNPQDVDDVCIIGAKSWLDNIHTTHSAAVGPNDFLAQPGTPCEAGAHIAIEALELAASGCIEGRYRSVVTAPISKWWLKQAGWSFDGQTEFFANRWQGQATMAFAGGKLKVVLATRHIPLSKVPSSLNYNLLEGVVKDAAKLAHKLGGAKVPRIAVCGLNPHAGEGGLIGHEEQDTIDPILDRLRQQYKGLSKCQPADTVFWRHLHNEFDVVIALYHDQGLAPLKTVDFDTAANLSLGLEFVRTSPDHGTAFDIAGKNIANIKSFTNAVRLAKIL